MLGLNPRSLTIPLYTETGLYPVMHRRAEAALKYLSYLATKRPTLPWVALLEAQDFTTRGNGSTQKDLHEYLMVAGSIALVLRKLLDIFFASYVLPRPHYRDHRYVRINMNSIPKTFKLFQYNGILGLHTV